jgi:hypothetical protein
VSLAFRAPLNSWMRFTVYFADARLCEDAPGSDRSLGKTVRATWTVQLDYRRSYDAANVK